MTARKVIKTVLPLGLGHATSAFDLFLFGMLTKEIAHIFFPCVSNLTYILSLMLFAIPFFVRPFGGVFMGYIAHQYGSHFSLKLAAIFSIASGVLLASMPSYEQIGIAAPLIIAVCRILQGIATSAEYANGSVIISETFLTDKTFSVAILISFGFMGVLLAAFVIYGLNSYAFLNFRYAFSLSAVLAILTYFLRRDPPQLEDPPSVIIASIPLCTFYFSCISLVVFSGTMSLCFYFCIFSLNEIYIDTLTHRFMAIYMNMAVISCWVIGIPLVGYFSRYFPIKTIIFLGQGVVFLACALYLAVSESLATLIFLEIAVCLGGILISAPASRIIPLYLPQHLRFRWFAFLYNLGQAVIASTAPIVTMFLMDVLFLSFKACVVYLMIIIGLSIIVFIRFEKTHQLVAD